MHPRQSVGVIARHLSGPRTDRGTSLPPVGVKEGDVAGPILTPDLFPYASRSARVTGTLGSAQSTPLSCAMS
jgi:hypothetical protein